MGGGGSPGGVGTAPGAVLSGWIAGGAAGAAGAACVGTVGGAAGVTFCTATRTFSMFESTSSSEKLGCPRGSLTSTLAFSPSCTL
jgi:hypothetical protein